MSGLSDECASTTSRGQAPRQMKSTRSSNHSQRSDRRVIVSDMFNHDRSPNVKGYRSVAYLPNRLLLGGGTLSQAI